jgi:hypothetical protein
MNNDLKIPISSEKLTAVLMEQAGCSLNPDEINRVCVAVASTVVSVEEGRDVVAGNIDRAYHFDLSKAVPAVAAVLAALGKAITDPTFVSWLTVLASLGQLRGVTMRISKSAIALCVALRGVGKVQRAEALKRVTAATGETLTPEEFAGALHDLDKLGVVEVTGDSLELKERILIRI